MVVIRVAMACCLPAGVLLGCSSEAERPYPPVDPVDSRVVPPPPRPDTRGWDARPEAGRRDGWHDSRYDSRHDTRRSDSRVGPLAVEGQVCAITDLLFTTCAPSPGKLKVKLLESGREAVTDPSGHFHLDLPATPPTLTIQVSDPNAVRTVRSGVARPKIPAAGGVYAWVEALNEVYLEDVAVSNRLYLVPGLAIVLVHVLDINGLAFAGANVRGFSPVNLSGPYFDAGDSLVLSPDGPTGSAGLVVFFNVPTGKLTLTLEASGYKSLDVELPTVADAVTGTRVTMAR